MCVRCVFIDVYSCPLILYFVLTAGDGEAAAPESGTGAPQADGAAEGRAREEQAYCHDAGAGVQAACHTGGGGVAAI